MNINMKIGSLVECISSDDWDVLPETGEIQGILPQYKQIYTVSFIEEYKGYTFLSFEEIPDEWDAESFIEIQIPPLLEAKIQECLTREFELT